MNRQYAHQGRFFNDTEAIRQVAEAVSGADLSDFFVKYVAGTAEIPYDDFLRAVGLQLAKKSITTADLGFIAVRNFNAPPTVTRLETDSSAYRAGLSLGDAIIQINGRPSATDFQERLAQLRPGDTIRLKVRDRSGERDLEWKLEQQEETTFEVVELPHATKQQKAQRGAWLKAENLSEPKQ
jgi:predicted metalloprotease with PDZ domain